MTMADKMTGPIWLSWVVTAIFLIISVILITGHGSGLIAGYNTASKEEKEKYNVRKLCKVMGFGMGAITIMFLLMNLFYKQLPASFAYVILAFIIIDVIIIAILSNTICKK